VLCGRHLDHDSCPVGEALGDRPRGCTPAAPRVQRVTAHHRQNDPSPAALTSSDLSREPDRQSRVTSIKRQHRPHRCCAGRSGSGRRLPRPNLLLAILLALANVLMAGCSSMATPAQERGSGGPVAAGRGWLDHKILGPVPAPGSCHLRHAGEPLPDPNCTLGAVDEAVSPANLRTTVCRKGGYTASVRPPARLTNAIKRRLLAAYGIPAADTGRYELDHLLSGAATLTLRDQAGAEASLVPLTTLTGVARLLERSFSWPGLFGKSLVILFSFSLITYLPPATLDCESG
jgi:hypothetical protein